MHPITHPAVQRATPKDVIQGRPLPRRFGLWAKRSVGMLLVVCGGSLLVADALHAVQASVTTSTSAAISVPSNTP